MPIDNFITIIHNHNGVRRIVSFNDTSNICRNQPRRNNRWRSRRRSISKRNSNRRSSRKSRTNGRASTPRGIRRRRSSTKDLLITTSKGIIIRLITGDNFGINRSNRIRINRNGIRINRIRIGRNRIRISRNGIRINGIRINRNRINRISRNRVSRNGINRNRNASITITGKMTWFTKTATNIT